MHRFILLMPIGVEFTGSELNLTIREENAMKVTFVIQDLFALGAQYVTALMIRGFIAAGYDVDLIVSQVHQDLLNQHTIHPFEIPHKVRVILLPFRKARWNVPTLRRYLKTTDASAVIAMSANYTTALGYAAIGLRRKCKLVHVEHSCLDLAPELWMSPQARKRGLLRSRIVYMSMDAILCVSQGTARRFKEFHPWYKKNVAVVYNPVIDDLFACKVKGNMALLHPWLSDKRCPTFVAAGAHTDCKGHITLLQAILRCNQVQKVRLVLFGRGELTETYKSFVKENHLQEVVSIAGYTDNLPLQISRADGVIISSLHESFSIVLVEALACEKPIISTNCEFGPPEILCNGEYGILVPVGDEESMAEAILKVANGGGIIPPRESWEKFTVSKIVERYERELGLKESARDE